MTEDTLLAERLAPLVDAPAAPDWGDVTRRVRRARRRRALTTALVVVAAVVVAAPAFGLGRYAIDWLSADPAPDRVQLDFAQLGVGAPKGMDPGIVPNAARKVTVVTLSDGPHTLWVAPTKSGGFCVTWTGLWGGCRSRKAPAALPSPGSWDLRPWDLGMTLQQEHGATTRLGGSLLAPEAVRLVVDYEDGASDEIPFTWVSPPIDAAFYAYEIPTEHRAFGHRATSLRAVDANGEDVARASIPTPPPDELLVPQRLPDGTSVFLPRKALAAKAHRVTQLTTENGTHVAVWTLPTTDGGTCYVYNRGSGCPPLGYEQTEPMAASLASGSNPILLLAQVTPAVASVELRYEDGSTGRITPTDGFALTEVRPEHYPRGHRLKLVIALDRNGRELQRQTFDTSSTGTYPCEKPVDIGKGVMSCP
ncbi:MAG TPA: hypothetical protein VN746_11455 [Gaiella sp.]|nr:hypothetical protein [Gaiella sp.]